VGRAGADAASGSVARGGELSEVGGRAVVVGMSRGVVAAMGDGASVGIMYTARGGFVFTPRSLGLPGLSWVELCFLPEGERVRGEALGWRLEE
jgi:hypothetical protein